MEHTPPTSQTNLPGGSAGHEERDVTFRPILWAGGGLIALVIVSLIAIRLLLGYFATREARRNPPPNPLAEHFARQVPPEPRLQPDPLKDLLELHAQEDAVLTTYGWVDRDAGVVRLPIERAIELLAERGLPSRPASHEAAKE